MTNWIQTILSEDNGIGSWSRVQNALTWTGAMALVWFSTITTRDIPPSAQVVVLSLLAAATGNYAVNRFTNKPVGSSPKEQA